MHKIFDTTLSFKDICNILAKEKDDCYVIVSNGELYLISIDCSF